MLGTDNCGGLFNPSAPLLIVLFFVLRVHTLWTATIIWNLSSLHILKKVKGKKIVFHIFSQVHHFHSFLRIQVSIWLHFSLEFSSSAFLIVLQVCWQ